MYLDTLYYLIELSKSKSMTQVANKLNISPSAMSQAINQVESQLGLKLFNRTPSGTYPTLEGEYIIASARQVIAAYNMMLDQVEILKNGIQKPLRIGASNEVPSFLLDLLLDFQGKQDQFNVELSEYQSQEIVSLIEDDKLDLGLIYVTSEYLRRLTDFQFEKLYDDQVKLFMAQDHYLAKRETLDIDLLKEQEFVSFQDEYITALMQSFQEKYGPVKVVTTTSSVRVLLEMIRKFKGVSFIRSRQLKQNLSQLPENYLVEKDASDFVSIPLSYGIVYKKEASFTALEWEFIETIKHHFV